MWNWLASFGQNLSIKRRSHARELQRDRLDLDAHDLSPLRIPGHRVGSRVRDSVQRRIGALIPRAGALSASTDRPDM
jgi:hypothetical protein